MSLDTQKLNRGGRGGGRGGRGGSTHSSPVKVRGEDGSLRDMSKRTYTETSDEQDDAEMARLEAAASKKGNSKGVAAASAFDILGIKTSEEDLLAQLAALRAEKKEKDLLAQLAALKKKRTATDAHEETKETEESDVASEASTPRPSKKPKKTGAKSPSKKAIVVSDDEDEQGGEEEEEEDVEIEDVKVPDLDEMPKNGAVEGVAMVDALTFDEEEVPVVEKRFDEETNAAEVWSLIDVSTPNIDPSVLTEELIKKEIGDDAYAAAIKDGKSAAKSIDRDLAFDLFQKAHGMSVQRITARNKLFHDTMVERRTAFAAELAQAAANPQGGAAHIIWGKPHVEHLARAHTVIAKAKAASVSHKQMCGVEADVAELEEFPLIAKTKIVEGGTYADDYPEPTTPTLKDKESVYCTGRTSANVWLSPKKREYEAALKQLLPRYPHPFNDAHDEYPNRKDVTTNLKLKDGTCVKVKVPVCNIALKTPARWSFRMMLHVQAVMKLVYGFEINLAYLVTDMMQLSSDWRRKPKRKADAAAGGSATKKPKAKRAKAAKTEEAEEAEEAAQAEEAEEDDSQQVQ